MSELKKSEKINERLLSVLIGLARATEGNEELITEETTSVLLKGLAMLIPGKTVAGTELEEAHQLTEFLAEIREEKQRLVPNCFDCASPCGRTSDYDMQEFWDAEEERVMLKLDIVKRLAEIASGTQEKCLLENEKKAEKTVDETMDACYEALIVLGWNGSRESLLRVLGRLK